MGRDDVSHGGLWDLAVLCLLREEPMHPYQMLRLLRDRHKDDVLVLKRGSLYHAIRRLEGAGFIEAGDVSREGKRPERTTYRLTAPGESERVRRLKARVARLDPRPPDLVASLNFLVYLQPKEALAELQARASALEAQVAAVEEMLGKLATFLERIHLIESEFLLAARKAELHWVKTCVAELRSGRLSWDLREVLKAARAERRRAGARRKEPVR